MTTIAVPAGGFRYVPGVFQYSAGVAAEPGFRIVRVRFERPVPLADGFARIERYLEEGGRPTTAFCACELRSPEPFTEAGFEAFNEVYVGTLERWGLYRDGANPVARSNVCPERHKPAEPSFHAFSFTVEAPEATSSFVVAGSGEAKEGQGSYADNTVRLHDTSPDGLMEKARFVLGEMERRMAALGFGWADTTAAQLYTVFDAFPTLDAEIVRRGAMEHGLTWHFCRPPVVGLDFEMDCRRVATEEVIET
ncbi:MAG: hypothetical protein ACOCYE_11360 [Pseudomonadota bacterium]